LTMIWTMASAAFIFIMIVSFYFLFSVKILPYKAGSAPPPFLFEERSVLVKTAKILINKTAFYTFSALSILIPKNFSRGRRIISGFLFFAQFVARAL